MRYFPIFVDLDRQPVLVIGDGEGAAQKVRLLLKSTARIELVAREPNQELQALLDNGRIGLAGAVFETAMLSGRRLVYAASDDQALNAKISMAARARSIPVNVVDRPQFCSFITPSIVDRDPVVVAISTEGTAPVLARQIKSKLEAMLPAGLGALAGYAKSLRKRVACGIADGRGRRRFWDGFFNGPLAQAYLTGDRMAAEQGVDRSLRTGFDQQGSVSLVGAGPGDPDLLTFKAMQRLQEADVIVADRLVGHRILEAARRDARRIMVGKTPGKPSPSQDEINAILLDEAKRGMRVVRLKGGDPFIFGRGGEELAFLEERGISVDVVPGISAALACAASIKLPLTTRGERRSITLMTGHASDGLADHDWQKLAKPGQMIAVYMGIGAASHIQGHMLAAGIDPTTPVTVVENGTLPNQKLALGAIGGLTETIIDAAVKGPAIIFIGAHPTDAVGTQSVDSVQPNEPWSVIQPQEFNRQSVMGVQT